MKPILLGQCLTQSPTQTQVNTAVFKKKKSWSLLCNLSEIPEL